MGKKSVTKESAPVRFASIEDASAVTGLSMYFLRRGVKDGTIPHIRSGAKFYINIPMLLEKLDAQSRKGVKK